MKQAPLLVVIGCIVGCCAVPGVMGIVQAAPLHASSLPPSAVDAMEQQVKHSGGYDLHSEDLGAIKVDGWEGFPTRLYRYRMKDGDGTVKTGLAVLLDPSPRQVARWIVQAVIDARGTYDTGLAHRLLLETRDASGFQFLVRGVHWEDMQGNGKNVAYPFRDGVTVQLKRFGATYPTRVLTPDELDYTVHAPEGEVLFTGKYARIQSTTRGEYRAAGGTKPVDGANWRTVVRELYQAAWGNDRNELMTAKARAL